MKEDSLVVRYAQEFRYLTDLTIYFIEIAEVETAFGCGRGYDLYSAQKIFTCRSFCLHMQHYFLQTKTKAMQPICIFKLFVNNVSYLHAWAALLQKF